MGQTTVNIRMDKTCKELGMNMSTAITIFAKKNV